MRADTATALAIYAGTMGGLAAIAYYLWNWGGK
jgi:hypothetical protein